MSGSTGPLAGAGLVRQTLSLRRPVCHAMAAAQAASALLLAIATGA